MISRIDLHSHSCHSDGALTPAALVRLAHGRGVEVLALTDHDTTAGIEMARAEARALGLVLVPGVEISVTWSQRLIHILGLGIDTGCPQLQQGLSGLRAIRHARARAIAERLDRIGISGSLAAVESHVDGDAVGRNHFARFLVEQGHARDRQQAFKRYLGRGGRCHVASEWAQLDQAVGWIKAAGGAAVVAHPARYGMTQVVMRRFLADFTQSGGGGIEVVSSSHDAHQARRMAAYAAEFGLAASAGSDFHEPDATWAVLGRLDPLPQGCVPIWGRWDTCRPQDSRVSSCG